MLHSFFWISLTLPLVAFQAASVEPPDLATVMAAAESGDVDAQYKLGGMYGSGRGVPKNDELAVKWFRRAAAQNDPRGQSMLGVMYTNARGVERDYDQAISWFRKAAAQNSAHACYNLGFMYATGKGVERNDVESANWYRKAAEKNDANSQRILSGMYAAGRGVTRDLTAAHAWMTVYAIRGGDAAKMELAKLAEQMTPAQLAVAKKLADELTARLPPTK